MAGRPLYDQRRGYDVSWLCHEGDVLVVHWLCRDGSLHTERYTCPPTATRQARATAAGPAALTPTDVDA